MGPTAVGIRMPHGVATMRHQQDFSSKTAAATCAWPWDKEHSQGSVVHARRTLPFVVSSSPVHRTGRKGKLFLDQARATSRWQSICPSEVAIWEKVSFIPAEQQGAAAWQVSGWVDL